MLWRGERAQGLLRLVLSFELGHDHVTAYRDDSVDHPRVGIDFDDVGGDGGALFDQLL